MHGPEDTGGRRGVRAYVFSRAAIRELDRLAVEEFGMPSILLMENAARGCAEAIAVRARVEGTRVLIVCGPGNNGGDGFAMARHLSNAGARVAVVVVDPTPPGKRSADAATNLAVIRSMRLPAFVLESRMETACAAASEAIGGSFEIVVDALLGTGVDRAVSGLAAKAIEWMNAQRAGRVFAVDIPSGLDADTGKPAGGELGVAVRAETTLTLGGLKQGFLKAWARQHTGDVVVVDLGVPMDLVRRLGRPPDNPPAR